MWSLPRGEYIVCIDNIEVVRDAMNDVVDNCSVRHYTKHRHKCDSDQV